MGMAVHPSSKQCVDDWQLCSALWDLNIMEDKRNLASILFLHFLEP